MQGRNWNGTPNLGSQNGQYAAELNFILPVARYLPTLLRADCVQQDKEFDIASARNILTMLPRPFTILDICIFRTVWPVGYEGKLVVWMGKPDNICKPRQKWPASEATTRSPDPPKPPIVEQLLEAMYARQIGSFMQALQHAGIFSAAMAWTLYPRSNTSVARFVETTVIYRQLSTRHMNRSRTSQVQVKTVLGYILHDRLRWPIMCRARRRWQRDSARSHR